jgi:hypothetical protein
MSTSQAANNSLSYKLIIKAANQKYSDFIIENCDSTWSIKQLKKHLNENYPKNPVSQFELNFLTT